MAIRTILHYPDKRLREKGQKIERVTDAIRPDRRILLIDADAILPFDEPAADSAWLDDFALNDQMVACPPAKP